MDCLLVPILEKESEQKLSGRVYRLIIDKEQIDILIERAWKSLDEGMSNVKEKGLWESAPI